MIEIDEPPDIAACASCGSVLVWLYSYRTGRTFSVIPDKNNPHGTLHIHTCRHGQDPVTWRQVPKGEPPNEDYREAREAIKNKNRIDNEE